MLVEVAFKGNRKEFFLWDGPGDIPGNAAVVVAADRGEDLGLVRAVGDLAERRARGVPHRPGEDGVKLKVRRLASREDLRRNEELRVQDEDARRRAGERVRAAGLQMKLTDAEWRWDRRKLTFYFTAEKRVDFRALVRELASLFRTRIELKQIGVRDEAKRLGGIGRCGREYCSASWLPDLRPVNLGVARDQKLSLNPTQISGACGRLMCCLRYEHDFYVQQRRRFPKEGKFIETSRGEEKVLSNDIFRERVSLRSAEGDVRTLPLADLRREWRNRPTTIEMPVDDEQASPDEGVSEEVLRLQDTSELPAWAPRPPGRAQLPIVSGPPRAPRRKADETDVTGKAGGSPPRGSQATRVERARPAADPGTDPAQARSSGSSEASEPDAPLDEQQRRKRRRGRRGGRKGRDAGGAGSDGSSGGEGGQEDGPGGQ